MTNEQLIINVERNREKSSQTFKNYCKSANKEKHILSRMDTTCSAALRRSRRRPLPRTSRIFLTCVPPRLPSFIVNLPQLPTTIMSRHCPSQDKSPVQGARRSDSSSYQADTIICEWSQDTRSASTRWAEPPSTKHDCAPRSPVRTSTSAENDLVGLVITFAPMNAFDVSRWYSMNRRSSHRQTAAPKRPTR